jgi:hypothetical protein
MKLRKLVCGAVLALGLCQTIAPAGAACEGADCRHAATSRRPSQPLQLGNFTRPATAKSVAPKSRKRTTQAKQARQRAAVPLPPPKEQPLPAEAATAFAAQPAVAVRVVTSEELNEIDLAAGPAPAETTGIGPRGEDEVQLVDASDFNDIDRKSDVSPMASAMASAAAVEGPAPSQPASASFIERFWAMLQNAFAALGTAFHYLFG